MRNGAAGEEIGSVVVLMITGLRGEAAAGMGRPGGGRFGFGGEGRGKSGRPVGCGWSWPGKDCRRKKVKVIIGCGKKKNGFGGGGVSVVLEKHLDRFRVFSFVFFWCFQN